MSQYKLVRAVAGDAFLCVVNLTYLNAEFLAANGRLFKVETCQGE